MAEIGNRDVTPTTAPRPWPNGLWKKCGTPPVPMTIAVEGGWRPNPRTMKVGSEGVGKLKKLFEVRSAFLPVLVNHY